MFNPIEKFKLQFYTWKEIRINEMFAVLFGNDEAGCIIPEISHIVDEDLVFMIGSLRLYLTCLSMQIFNMLW